MLEILCQSAPDNTKPNEDTYIVYEQNFRQPRYILAVIDGATSVAFYEPLIAYLREHRHGISPAALAAAVTRDAILQYVGQMTAANEIHPRDLLLHANQTLRALLDEVAVGIFDAEAIIAHNPAHAEILTDPRKIRLYLPAAVATIAVIDTDAQTLYYGHIGDTALILAHSDGRLSMPTQNQVRGNYESALYATVKQVAGQGLAMLEVVNHPLIQTLNRDQRLYHNFVDEHGQTATNRGTGVINGLPELADYIKTEVISLQDVESILLATDGFLWHTNPLDPTDNFMRHVQYMWNYMRQHGASRYLAHLRAEERADNAREKFPRLKLHDDATAILLHIS